MPRGSSGRIVVEISPVLKARLYTCLDLHQLTMKQWLEAHAADLIGQSAKSSSQLMLPLKPSLAEVMHPKPTAATLQRRRRRSVDIA
jgi:hypothetical protein